MGPICLKYSQTMRLGGGGKGEIRGNCIRSGWANLSEGCDG